MEVLFPDSLAEIFVHGSLYIASCALKVNSTFLSISSFSKLRNNLNVVINFIKYPCCWISASKAIKLNQSIGNKVSKKTSDFKFNLPNFILAYLGH